MQREPPQIEVNCVQGERQCRPTLEQDCNQSKTTNCVKTFVNGSKNSVSTHEQFFWDTNLSHDSFAFSFFHQG